MRLKETAYKTGERLEEILQNLKTPIHAEQDPHDYFDIVERYELATQENIELQSRLQEEAEIHESFQKVMTARINEANAKLAKMTSENERLKADLELS